MSNSVLALAVGALLVVGIAGVVADFAGSSRRRWVATLGPALIGLAGVAWHKVVLHYFAGQTFLRYGYFETAQGAAARPWAIFAPWVAVLIGLVAFFAIASIFFTRRVDSAAKRTSLYSTVITFVLFSAYMALALAQGDASVFI